MILGVDLGGHSFALGFVRDGSVLSLREYETPRSRTAEAVSAALRERIDEMASGIRVDGIGIGVPGMLDLEREKVLRSPNFPGWEGLPLRYLLEKSLGIPVRMENDANCTAIGEGLLGAACGLKHYIVLTLGTGIGGGIVIGGRLLRGGHGMAGEPGHLVIGGMNPCGCGGLGHLETVAGADGIERRAKEAGIKPDLKSLWEQREDPRVEPIWRDALEALGASVASLVHILDPEAVVLGGGLGPAAGFVEALEPIVKRHLGDPYRSLLDLRIARLGKAAAVIGAASLFLPDSEERLC
jgi:glucokinase